VAATGWKLPNKLQFRMDNNAHTVKFDTRCFNANPIVVGDRFGSWLVTGFENDAGDICYKPLDVQDYLPTGLRLDNKMFVADSKSGSSRQGGSSVLAIGTVLAVVVLAIGTAYVRQLRKQSDTQHVYFEDDCTSMATSDAGSAMSHGSHTSEGTESFTSSPTGTTTSSKRRKQTAMDLMHSRQEGQFDISKSIAISCISSSSSSSPSSTLAVTEEEDYDTLTRQSLLEFQVAFKQSSAISIDTERAMIGFEMVEQGGPFYDWDDSGDATALVGVGANEIKVDADLPESDLVQSRSPRAIPGVNMGEEEWEASQSVTSTPNSPTVNAV
jgi:hypothetical protein